MKELWSKSTALLWANPVLWVPVLCADLLGFFLNLLQKTINRSIVQWLVLHTHSSVLGGAPDLATERALEFKAALSAAPLTWGAYFVTVYLYAVALAMTAGLVLAIVKGLQPDMQVQSGFVRARRAAIFSLSVKIFGLMVAAILVMGVAIVQAVGFFGRRIPASSVGLVSALVAFAAIAFFIAPSALRLIGGDTSEVSANGIGEARRFAVIAVMSSVAIGYFCGVAVHAIRAAGTENDGTARGITDAAASLITALPYIPLFVILALVAFKTGESPIEPDADAC